MANVSIKLNGQQLSVPVGISILDAATQAGVHIPTLCAMEKLGVRASCKLCMVEIKGEEQTKLSCATKVADGMEIITDSQALYDARRELVTEMFRQHTIDCLHCLRIGSSRPESLDPWFCENCFWCDCVREGFCELQALSREFNIGKLPFEVHEHDFENDNSTDCIVRDPNKCVKCRRCVDVCNKVQNVGILGVVKTPNGATIGAKSGSMAESGCIRCGRCVDVCPTGALYMTEHMDETVFYAHEYDVKTAALLDREVVTELERLFKAPEGSFSYEQVSAGLKKIGIDHVYSAQDASNAAWEKAGETIGSRLGKEPVIVTDDYSAKAFLTANYPELSSQFIFVDSAQKVFGDELCERQLGMKLWSVSAKNSNAAEAQDTGCVDFFVNARELFRLFKRTGVDPAKRKPESIEDLFGASAPTDDFRVLTAGGWQLDGSAEELVFSCDGKSYKAAVCHNLSQAAKAIKNIAKYDLIRVIA